MNSGRMAKSGLTVSASTAPTAGKGTNGDLHLAHQWQHLALTAIHRQAGFHPRLRSAGDQHTAIKTRALEFLDGFARAPGGLAQDVNGLVLCSPLIQKGNGVKIGQREQSGARHMRGGMFAGRTDVQKFNRIFPAQQLVKFMRRDDRFAFGRHPLKSPAGGEGLHPPVFGNGVNHQRIIHRSTNGSRF